MDIATNFSGGLQHKFNDNFSGFFRGYSYTANNDYDRGSMYGSATGNEEAQNYNQSGILAYAITPASIRLS